MWSVEYTDKDGNTKHRFYEQFKDPLTGRYRRTSVVMNKATKASENEARRRLDDRIAALIEASSGGYKNIDDKTFYDVAMEWFEEYQLIEDVKQGTIKRKQTELNQIFKYFGKDALFVNVSFRHLQDFIYHKQSEGLFYRTLGSYAITIRAIYKYARTGDYKFEPKFNVSDLRIPKDKRSYEQTIQDRNENKYLTDKEIDDIQGYLDYKLKHRKRPDVNRNLRMIKYIIEFQLLNGMRISELMAIESHNIDLDNQTVTIDGSIQWYSSDEGFGYKDTTKTDNSTRTIGLTQRSVDILRKVMLENRKEVQWNHAYKDRGFVFTGSTGSPMPKDKVNVILKEAADWCGIDKKVTSHILRHTNISVMASLGIPLKAIMQRVGHSDYRTTLQIYTHVNQKMEEDAISKLEDANF